MINNEEDGRFLSTIEICVKEIFVCVFYADDLDKKTSKHEL